jgi:threonine/homoserine efflux transporter RhtA
MNLGSLPREQKALGAAGASLLFAISLLFPWFDALGDSVSGFDALYSGWLVVAIAVVVAGVLAADARGIHLPARLGSVGVAAYLASLPFVLTLMAFLDDRGGRRWGMYLGLLFAILALAGALLIWREDRRP